VCREKNLFSVRLSRWTVGGTGHYTRVPNNCTSSHGRIFSLWKKGNYSLSVEVEKGVLTCKDCGIAAI